MHYFNIATQEWSSTRVFNQQSSSADVFSIVNDIDDNRLGLPSRVDSPSSNRSRSCSPDSLAQSLKDSDDRPTEVIGKYSHYLLICTN